MVLLLTAFPAVVFASAPTRAAFIYVNADRTHIEPSEHITFTILTSDADAVAAQVDGMIISATRTAGFSGETGWELVITPKMTQTIIIMASGPGGSAAVLIPITVIGTSSEPRPPIVSPLPPSPIRPTPRPTPTTTPTPTPRPPLLNQAAIPLLVSAMANTTAVISGEPIIVSVRTNTYARHVWAVVDSVRVEAVAGATSNNIRSWVITVVPNGTQVIDVFASAATGPVRLANRRIPVMVEHEAVTINRAQAQIQTVGDQIPRQVIVTIVTNRSAEWVDVLVPGMNASLPATKRQTQGNEVIWTLTYTPTSGWLEHPIRIFAGEDRHGTGDSRILTRFES